MNYVSISYSVYINFFSFSNKFQAEARETLFFLRLNFLFYTDFQDFSITEKLIL
jgi:hypothetical protein